MRKLQEARHWLGEDLKSAGELYPYAREADPKITVVHPPANAAAKVTTEHSEEADKPEA
jgi:hypothetical protein